MARQARRGKYTDKAKKHPTSRKKEAEPTGISEIDGLDRLEVCSVQDYIRAVSAYVRKCSLLDDGPKKAAQIRLSNSLAKAFARDFETACPEIERLAVGERKVSGALRTMNADVSQAHPLDGLRLAIELKPVNLAVGRAIWNRFGDLRTFAVNLHLKFPFCVIGGVLVVPTSEEVGTKAASEADAKEYALQEDLDLGVPKDIPTTEPRTPPARRTKSTTHLIERAVQRLVRAGGRKTEGDAPHLLEAISVIAYDPETSTIDPDLPAPETGLRWDHFIRSLAIAYRGRFED
jgi:hypothetical protein